MKTLKQTIRLLLLTVILCSFPTVTALAADDSSVWFELKETAAGTAVQIVTDTTVTDGVVELTYDSSALTYKDVTVTEAYVAMYSVNAEEAGTVRISWVAPGEYEANSAGVSLIQVNFTGKAAAEDIALSGTAYSANGDIVPVKGNASITEPEKPGPGGNGSGSSGSGNSGSGSSGSSNPPATTNPGTGDSAAPLLLLAVAACALIACAGISVMKRRAEK